jgi:ABC-type transporter Mla MlaB component
MSDQTEEIKLEGPMTLWQLDELKERLLAAFDKGNGVALDLSGVIEADSAFLQLLLGVNLEAQKRSTPLTFVGEPNEMISGLAKTVGFIPPKDAPEGWPW